MLLTLRNACKAVCCAETDENIIIVSHDGTLSVLYALWLGMDIEMLNKCNLSGKTGGVSVLQEDDDGNRIIARLNDMSYMRGALK